VSVDLHSRVLSDNVFQTDGAATEKARREIWVLVLGTDNGGVWEERSSLGGSAMWISSLKYAGVDVARTLYAMMALQRVPPPLVMIGL